MSQNRKRAFELCVILAAVSMSCGKSKLAGSAKAPVAPETHVEDAQPLSCLLQASSGKVAAGAGVDVTYHIDGAATHAKLDGQDLTNLSDGSVHVIVKESKDYVMDVEAADQSKVTCKTSVQLEDPLTVSATQVPGALPACSIASSATQVVVGSHDRASVTLTITGTNIVTAAITGSASMALTASSLSTSVPITVNANPSAYTTGNKYSATYTYSATATNASGSTPCGSVSVTGIGYKIPDGLMFRYKAADGGGLTFYGNGQYTLPSARTAATPVDTYYQQRCLNGAAAGYKSHGALSSLSFSIAGKPYYLGDVVGIDPGAATKTKNVHITASIANSTGSGPNGTLTSESAGDIQFFFEGGSNTLAIQGSGSGTSWPIGVGRGLDSTQQLNSVPTSSITYPNCN